MTSEQRTLKANIEKLNRANKELSKALKTQTELTAAVLDTLTKILNK